MTTTPLAIDTAALRQVLDAAQASKPGRWHWAGNTDCHNVTLATWVPGHGRVTVLSCARAGMQSAEFQFCDPDTTMLKRVRDLVQYEVCHAATSRTDKRVYRADIDDVRHPDAQLILAAVNNLGPLLDEVERLQTEVACLRAGIAHMCLTSAHSWTAPDERAEG